MAGDRTFKDELEESKRYENMMYRHLMSSKGFNISKNHIFKPGRKIYTSYDKTWASHPDFRIDATNVIAYIEHKKVPIIRCDKVSKYFRFKTHIYNQYKHYPVIIGVYGETQKQAKEMWFLDIDEIYNRENLLTASDTFGRDSKPYYRIPDYWFTNYGKIWDMKNKTWLSQE